MKKLIYIQCSGGIGAQVLSALAAKYFSRDLIFFDASYFGNNGSKLIPDNIYYFNKTVSDDLLKFNFFEMNRYFCWLARKVISFMSKYSKNILFLDDSNQLKLNYACRLKDKDFINKINIELFKNIRQDSIVNIAHIRRGDYLAAGLPLLEIKQLLDILLEERIDPNDLNIITDSPDEILNEFKKFDLNINIFSNDALTDLYIMTKAKTFIASDSQFSLISILLSDSIETLFIPKRWNDIGISKILMQRCNFLKIVEI